MSCKNCNDGICGDGQCQCQVEANQRKLFSDEPKSPARCPVCGARPQEIALVYSKGHTDGEQHMINALLGLRHDYMKDDVDLLSTLVARLQARRVKMTEG